MTKIYVILDSESGEITTYFGENRQDREGVIAIYTTDIRYHAFYNYVRDFGMVYGMLLPD